MKEEKQALLTTYCITYSEKDILRSTTAHFRREERS
jgi:hypothetical protein